MLSPINESGSVDSSRNTNQSKFVSNDVNKDTSSDAISVDGNKRSVIINEAQPLARCSVLYLGTAIPSDDERGIDSIQEPLSKRYPTDGTELARGIETWLSIDQNGLQIQFPQDPSVMIYYPIRSLAYCAAIRFATRTEAGVKFPNGWRFVPLDHPDATQTENAQNPPLFAISFHRTNPSTVDECHCFVAKTKQVTLALIQACFRAYQETDPDQDCSKVPLYFKINNGGTKIKETDSEIRIVPALDKEKTLNYQTNKNTSGYFYKTDQISIDDWHLGEQTKSGILRSSSNQTVNPPNRPIRSRRLASITSIPEFEKSYPPPPPPPSPPPNNSKEKSVPLQVDPFAPDPNVLRVERIKTDDLGREIFIRWIRNPSEIIPQIPPSQTPKYDFHVTYNAENQQREKILNDVQRLVLDEVFKKSVMFNDKPQSIPVHYEQKQSKKKRKHRKHKGSGNSYEKQSSTIFYNNNPSYNYPEVINLPTLTLSPTQQFPIPQQQQSVPIQPYPSTSQSIPMQPYAPTPQPASMQPYPSTPQPIPIQQYPSIPQPVPVQQYPSIQQPQSVPIQQYPSTQQYSSIQQYPSMQQYSTVQQYPSVQQYQDPQQQYMMQPYGMTYHTMDVPASQSAVASQNPPAPVWFYM